jgi:hypothetical protein
MRIHDNLFNPLPLFESKEDWYKNKETYKGKSSPTITTKNYLLPMQLTVDKEMYDTLTTTQPNILVMFRVISWDDKKTYRLNTEEVYRSIDLLPENIRNEENYASVFLGGRWLISHDIPIGTYYLSMTYGDTNDITASKEWYSDLFTFRADTSDLIKLSYRATKPIVTANNYMPFKEGVSERQMEVWIDATAMNNEFMFEDSVETMDGYDMVEKRVSYKKYNIVFLATEYMAEALRLLWHCDDVEMTMRGRRYKVNNTNIEVAWDIDNHFAKVTLKCKTDTVIQTNGIGIYAKAEGRAFSDDYNDDFD